MKKSQEINELNDEINSSIEKIGEELGNFTIQFSEYYKKIKKEMSKVLAEEKVLLLSKIAEGENMDINILKSKYLKSKELSILNKNTIKSDTKINEELLDRIEQGDNVYYYENKEKGKVYDSSYTEVGVYKNNSISFIV